MLTYLVSEPFNYSQSILSYCSYLDWNALYSLYGVGSKDVMAMNHANPGYVEDKRRNCQAVYPASAKKYGLAHGYKALATFAWLSFSSYS